jgi:hypothetical protein
VSSFFLERGRSAGQETNEANFGVLMNEERKVARSLMLTKTKLHKQKPPTESLCMCKTKALNLILVHSRKVNVLTGPFHHLFFPNEFFQRHMEMTIMICWATGWLIGGSSPCRG